MITTILLYGFMYLAVLVFLIACAVRAVYYARLPLHLRWELYPVPHEETARAEHGGSYFEVTNWWEKPIPFNLLGRIEGDGPGDAFSKGPLGVQPNPLVPLVPISFRSLPAHRLDGPSRRARLTYPVGSTPDVGRDRNSPSLRVRGGLAGGSGAGRSGSSESAGSPPYRRRFKTYSTAGDLFNLLFFIVTLGCLLAGYLFRPVGSPPALALAQGFLTFHTTLRFQPLLATGLVLSALLTAYIPMTHMSHFIAKYFTYHTVRWDNRPNLKGSDLARR